MTESQNSPTESPSETTETNPFAPSPIQAYLEALKPLEQLGPIAQSLELLTEAAQQTTPRQQSEQPERLSAEPPRTEIPAGANPDGDIVFDDGRTVPSELVRSLTDYDKVWPESVVPEARAAVAHAIFRVMEANKQPVLRTNYPFCLDPNPGNLSYESPCILRADHPGKHHDNNDGVW